MKYLTAMIKEGQPDMQEFFKYILIFFYKQIYFLIISSLGFGRFLVLFQVDLPLQQGFEILGALCFHRRKGFAGARSESDVAYINPQTNKIVQRN